MNDIFKDSSLLKRVQHYLLSKTFINNKSSFELNNERIPWVAYYLRIAREVSMRSTCIRRKYGAIIVSDDNRIISTGYNGSSINEANCNEVGICFREKHNIPHGEHYEYCVAVHAEANAIIKANRQDLVNSTIYIYGYDIDGNIFGEPCLMCQRMIKNSGIKKIVWLSDNSTKNTHYTINICDL